MPATLIARGRAADVFALGYDRVLRRYREGERGDAVAEAEVMTYARDQGFPAPAVHSASASELVLERVYGPTMLADLAHRPRLVRRHGQTLAELHNRLHSIPALPGFHALFGRGDCLAHFDLHPGNVVLTDRGPAVIDWSNSGRGEAADDVAVTWVILRTSTIPGALPFRARAGAGRSLLINTFLASVDADAARERLSAVARHRISTDPHLFERERRALQALLAN